MAAVVTDVRPRTFDPDDLPRAASVWHASGMEPPSAEEVAVKLTRDPELFLVAEVGGEIVGVAMGAYDGRRGWIYRFAVDPRHRRRGYGRALLEELERRFRAVGATHVRLLVRPDNVEGAAFWGRVGYDVSAGFVLGRKDLQ